MPFDAVFTFAVLILVVGLMALDIVSPDYLLLGALMVLAAVGVLDASSAAAALMFPIVLALAGAQGLDPRPLVLIATVAASLSFSTPLNYTTNIMVYGPGKYRFADFTRTGVPLQLLLSVVAVAVLQLVWPLRPA